MNLIQDLVISEIRLPVSVNNRLNTLLGSKLCQDPLTLAVNGWELKDKLKCRECSGNGSHEKSCIYNGNIQYNFPELDSASVIACFNKRAKGLERLSDLKVLERDINLSLIKSNFTDNIKLLSLFGWEYKSEDSITCYLCKREVGVWKIIDVENDHTYWCPWVRDCKRRGWEITFDKLTRKSTKSLQVQDVDQVYDWLNSIMPT
jgi:hypothetical protein